MLGGRIITEAAGGGHDQVRIITTPRADLVTYSLGAMSELKQPRTLPLSEEIA
ncbi:hypothetical protein GCM10017600_18410 [Streptosporangium carneum]|uniref:Uncharacterized protein n=1 Tax=Streptosporangium carneum TaxID=47481 RepID=A0A9W6HZ29_9ACTN|nr:hypothetical protein GCM10017600_18410 [Streptosporangium carneum]